MRRHAHPLGNLLSWRYANYAKFYLAEHVRESCSLCWSIKYRNHSVTSSSLLLNDYHIHNIWLNFINIKKITYITSKEKPKISFAS